MSVPEPQLDIASRIRQHALSIPGKLQMIMIAFAKALEVIPRQICDNAGLDGTDILNRLRQRHDKGERWAGVDVDGAEGVRDNLEAFVWEPSLVKVNAISSAVEAACLIISVDETVRNPQSEQVRLFFSAFSGMACGSLMKHVFCSPVLVRKRHLVPLAAR